MTFLYLSFDQWCLKQLLWRNTYMMNLWIIHFSSKLLEKATSIRNDVLITWNNLHAEQMLECFLSTSEKIFTYDWFYKRSVFILAFLSFKFKLGRYCSEFIIHNSQSVLQFATSRYYVIPWRYINAFKLWKLQSHILFNLRVNF